MTRLAITAMILLAAITSFAHAQKREPLPVKVYVLVGQSNMLGYGTVEGDKPNTLRDMVKKEPKKYQFLLNEDDSWKERSDVWIHMGGRPATGPAKYSGLTPNYGGYRGLIGPEFGFGHKMGDVYKQPVLLIKATWGGKSLGNDFLPPSIGKYPKPTKPNDPGFFFSEVVRLTNKVTENIGTFFPDYQEQGVEIAGLCYHQGWNDLGDLSLKYEENLAAFIKDIRSEKYGLGVPNLPIVIATSGNIDGEHLIKQSQLAMADKAKYPQFVGNVAVVDTDKPYGPEKLQFRFDPKDSPADQGFHWHRNARTHWNIGTAMATEMLKLKEPLLPSHLMTFGVDQGVQLNWQLGSETPKSVQLLRNGKDLGVKLPASQTAFTDTTALPGKNSYELVLAMPTSGTQKLTSLCDTSIPELLSFRSMEGVTLQWEAKGKFEGFKITRDGKEIAKDLPSEARIYEDKGAPEKGFVKYSIQPTTGNATPATTVVNRGPLDAGDALLYEPFDYPSSLETPTTLFGKKGAVGTKGEYFTLQKEGDIKDAPMVAAGNLRFGNLPVTGNRAQTSGHSPKEGYAIELDDSLAKAGLLKDGATMWISYVSFMPVSGGGENIVTLQSDDHKEGIGFLHKEGEFQTRVISGGEVAVRRIGPSWKSKKVLMAGKIVWGKDGENDNFYPVWPDQDLKKPEVNTKGKYVYLREPEAFNIDQTKLSRLVLQQKGGNSFDEIRVGPTYESVVGGGIKSK